MAKGNQDKKSPPKPNSVAPKQRKNTPQVCYWGLQILLPFLTVLQELIREKFPELQGDLILPEELHLTLHFPNPKDTNSIDLIAFLKQLDQLPETFDIQVVSIAVSTHLVKDKDKETLVQKPKFCCAMVELPDYVPFPNDNPLKPRIPHITCFTGTDVDGTPLKPMNSPSAFEDTDGIVVELSAPVSITVAVGAFYRGNFFRPLAEVMKTMAESVVVEPTVVGPTMVEPTVVGLTI